MAVLSSYAENGADQLLRVLYCRGPSDTELRRWVHVASTVSNGPPSAVLFGDVIAFTKWGGSDPGLYTVPVPEDFEVFRPVIVGPGGNNLVAEESFIAEGDQGEVEVLTRSSTSDPFNDGFDLPLPPCMALRMYKITSLASDPGSIKKWLCEIRVSSSADDSWDEVFPNWTATGRIRRLKAWVLNGSYDNGLFTPNKTIQLGTMLINVSDSASAVPTQYSPCNQWCPLMDIGYRTFNIIGGDVQGLGLRLTSSFGGGDRPDDNCFYLVLDTAMDNLGSTGYPLPPEEYDAPLNCSRSPSVGVAPACPSRLTAGRGR
ncbi:MAG: hypothetical protein JNM07_13865 [Phycisphaerae bacterium]|nr:hypothetical protein [Phycisphaerae bacterium]